MEDVIRRISPSTINEPQELLHREWLVTNGLGGYASGTLSGHVTRRYHGLLIAALPSPLGRIVMLNHVCEFLRFSDGRLHPFGGMEPNFANAADSSRGLHYLEEFRLENQLPVWRYAMEGVVIEKRVLLVHGQNTVHLTYTLISDQQGLKIELRPGLHFRAHEDDVGEPTDQDYLISIRGARYEIQSHGYPALLRMILQNQEGGFYHEANLLQEIVYQKEAERGYRSRGKLWSPGYFSLPLRNLREATLTASTEPWEILLALSPEQARRYEIKRRQRLISIAHPSLRKGALAELVIAADQFLIRPSGRMEDVARAQAAGDEVRSVIAGYHWFTDWGRDTMISLEGLTLATGRYAEAGWVLRTFAHYIRDGLIPNFFPDGKSEGVYHTADATLWYFHALERYLSLTGDTATLEAVLPGLKGILVKHISGTRFRIQVDPEDGLLSQGAEGYQLTWMDAKVDDWVVTPRRGKAVEINALWYNALCLMEGWLNKLGEPHEAQQMAERARRARESFNRRFWNSSKGFLFDVVDGETGDDDACRPNQILAISLTHPILEPSRWESVLDAVRSRLLTPVGLRSLSPEHKDYKPRYFGDLRARDAAYHQGTVWAWLIGPFIDAWLKTHPGDQEGARTFISGLLPHLDEACVGSISEVFDAEAPFTPRGCIAQAWSVAEILRCWVKTSPEDHASGLKEKALEPPNK
jgi:predicted glycogen debranching enzyme